MHLISTVIIISLVIVSDGTGYVEDGRDIFDDEDEYDAGPTSASAKAKDSKTKDGNKKRRLRDINAPEKGKSSIKSLFNNIVPSKKKETTIKLNEDDILTDILDELDTGKPSGKSPNSVALQQNGGRDEAKIVQNYLKNFTKTVRAPIAKKPDGNTSDDEMLDRILKPTKKDNASALKRVEPVKVLKSNAPVVEELAPEIPEMHLADAEENVEAEVLPTTADEKINDMDFSMLDDVENQFEIDTIVKEAVAVVCKPPAKIDETIFDDLLANWENIENCDEDLLNVTVGDESQQNEVHTCNLIFSPLIYF